MIKSFADEFPQSLSATPPTDVTREFLLPDLYEDKGQVIRGLLSVEESLFFIEEIEKLDPQPVYGISGGYQAEYRRNDRVMVDSQELASLLFARIAPFLRDIRITREDTQCVGQVFNEEGLWKPLGLNPRFRLCRYEPGGHFAPHFDACFKLVPGKKRSMLTCMFYLNGSPDFDGGATQFLASKQALWKDPADGVYKANEENILCNVAPEPGLLLLFHHHILHCGQQVQNGQKYIMRTDIMYECAESDAHGRTEQQRQALELFEKAGNLEAEGKYDEACKLYSKAYKLDPELENSKEN